MSTSMKHIISVPWSDEERTLLRQLRDNGLGPVRISQLLGRSKYSVTKQIATLRLPALPAPDMTPRVRVPQAKPLPPGARTLPPLPSEVTRNSVE